MSRGTGLQQFLPENVEERNILTSDGSLGGRVVKLPCNMSSNLRIADLISGSAEMQFKPITELLKSL